MPSCHYCGGQLEGRKPSREDVCPSCGRDVRACLNCTFYDEGAHNKCREPQTEWVGDRSRANFCDYFRFSNRPGKRAGSREASAKKRLDDLFRKEDS